MNQATYLNQAEAAGLLRISERTLERWRVEGVGPRFRRFGRRVIYSKLDLENWADGRCYQSTSENVPTGT